jgi:hypothetical protein
VDIDRDKRNVAQGIRILAKGTVTFSVVLEGRVRGIVEKELRSQGNNKKGAFERREDRKELRGGVVAVPSLMDETGAATQKDEKLSFDGDDLEDSRGILPFVGDEIEFNVYIDKPTKKRKATGIKITSYGKAGREQGVIIKVKEGLSVSLLNHKIRVYVYVYIYSSFNDVYIYTYPDTHTHTHITDTYPHCSTLSFDAATARIQSTSILMTARATQQPTAKKSNSTS